MTLNKKISSYLEMEDLSNEEQEEIKSSLEDIIVSKIIIRIAKRLPEEDKESFFKVIFEKESDEIGEFLKEKIDNLDEVIKEVSTETVNKFKRETSK